MYHRENRDFFSKHGLSKQEVKVYCLQLSSLE